MESKAYAQAYILIENLSEDIKKKIPQKVVNAIRSKIDVLYQLNIENKNIEEIELLDDTEKILSVIYTDYLATEEENKIIMYKEKEYLSKKEEEKKEKYLIDVFSNRKNHKKIAKKNEIITIKERWYLKFINKIKRYIERIIANKK